MIFNEEETGDTQQGHNSADHGENQGPALYGILADAHKAAKHSQNGHQRHHGVQTFRKTTVGVVRGIGKPGVEAGIIGAGAEEGHHAVQNDGQTHAYSRGGGHRGEEHADHIGANQGKAQNGDTPDHIAAADK